VEANETTSNADARTSALAIMRRENPPVARCRLDMGGTIPRAGDPRQRYVYEDCPNPHGGLARNALPIGLRLPESKASASLAERVTYGATRHSGQGKLVPDIGVDCGALDIRRFFSREKDPHRAPREPSTFS